MNKAAIRENMRTVRRSIAEDRRDAAAAALATHIHAFLAEHADNAPVIGTYYAVKDELRPPYRFNNAACALPVIRHKTTLEFYLWNEGENLVVREFDIPIPPTYGKNPVVPDVLLIPLMACDAHGTRIGYGAGHYDRYLAGLSAQPLLIGVAYDEQVSAVPLLFEPHDIQLDYIATPTGIIKTL